MLGQLILCAEVEMSRHPKAEDNVHGLVCLSCLHSEFRIITLDGCQGEHHFLPSRSGCDVVGLTVEGHIRILADLRLSDWSSKHHSITHFVHIKAGQVQFWSLRHFVGTDEAVLQLWSTKRLSKDSITKYHVHIHSYY